MTAQMRTGPAARDPSFRGIDPPALNQVIRQLQDAESAIRGWLNGHRPPPGVSAMRLPAGRRGRPVGGRPARHADPPLQLRRHAPRQGRRRPGAHAPVPGSRPGTVRRRRNRRRPRGGRLARVRVRFGRRVRWVRRPRFGRRDVHAGHPAEDRAVPRQPTPNGAGDLGAFPDRRAAAKAAKADALAVAAAAGGGVRVPGSVWTHLKANMRRSRLHREAL